MARVERLLWQSGPAKGLLWQSGPVNRLLWQSAPANRLLWRSVPVNRLLWQSAQVQGLRWQGIPELQDYMHSAYQSCVRQATWQDSRVGILLWLRYCEGYVTIWSGGTPPGNP